jgi:hypothetical protein
MIPNDCLMFSELEHYLKSGSGHAMKLKGAPPPMDSDSALHQLPAWINASQDA